MHESVKSQLDENYNFNFLITFATVCPSRYTTVSTTLLSCCEINNDIDNVRGFVFTVIIIIINIVVIVVIICSL